MGFTDLVSEAGLTLLNNFVKTRSYIIGYTPSQADVKVFQQIKEVPAPEKYPASLTPFLVTQPRSSLPTAPSLQSSP
ncbi:Elongation factor 1-beta [Pyrenophora tritici-repentis]|nr:Elongation factor 1-beta [Pyrenophora tritici-repentis]